MDPRSESPEDLARIVLDWQQPMYNLALRMLGNEADAADATQEIFAALLRGRRRLAGVRDPRTWVHRIGTNVVLNHIRGSRRRREREEAAAMQRPEARRDEPAEREEMQRRVQIEVSCLGEDDRALLVLHYYQGLSQDQVAATLRLPRTTLQHRLKKALAALRSRLTASGPSAVPFAELEHLMGGASAAPVPPDLTLSLLSAAQASGAAATAGLAFGGILMTKHIIAGAVAIAVLSVGAGVLAGRTLFAAPEPPAGRGTGSESDTVPRAEHDRILELHREAEAEIARLRTARDAGASALKATPYREQDPHDAAAAPEAAAGEERPEGGVGPLDWSKLGALFAKHAGLVAAHSDHSEDDEELTEEEQARLLELGAELGRMMRLSRGLSDDPFFDPAILPAYVGALCGDSLALTADQRERLAAATLSILEDQLGRFDPRASLPIESWTARQELLRGLAGSVEGLLNADQRERWPEIRRAAADLLSGNWRILNLGLGPGGDFGSPAEAVTGAWERAYGLTPGQVENARASASILAAEARTLLAQYGQLGASPPPLSPADRVRLEDDLARLQARVERDLFHFLTPDQVRRSQQRPPSIIRFNPGRDHSEHVRSGIGF